MPCSMTKNDNYQATTQDMNAVNFDPISELLTAQMVRPVQLRQVNLHHLTPFQRALLSIDGTVTKFIEAYMLEPVEVVVLKQRSQFLHHDHSWLALPAQNEVVARQVLLRGRYSATVYAYAVSLLVPARLPETLLRDLEFEPAGIGRMLLNSQIENRRDFLWYGCEHLPHLPEAIAEYTGHDFISRTYRVIVHNQPITLINEKFPVAAPATIPEIKAIPMPSILSTADSGQHTSTHS